MKAGTRPSDWFLVELRVCWLRPGRLYLAGRRMDHACPSAISVIRLLLTKWQVYIGKADFTVACVFMFDSLEYGGLA